MRRSALIAFCGIMLGIAAASYGPHASMSVAASSLPAAPCNGVAAAARFSQDGHADNPTAAIFRFWLTKWCGGTDLGPATSTEYPDGSTVVAQDFGVTANRLLWSKRASTVTVQHRWGWASLAFAAHGVDPAFGVNITRAWFANYFAGRNWGPALEPPSGPDGLCAPETQTFLYGNATFVAGELNWRGAARPASGQTLVQAAKWQPIGNVVDGFARTLVARRGSRAVPYVSGSLRRAAGHDLLGVLGLKSWPDHEAYSIQRWGDQTADVVSTWTIAGRKTVDTLHLIRSGTWRIDSVTRGAPAPQACAPPSPTPLPTPTAAPTPRPATGGSFPGTYGIGDSVMLDAQPLLAAAGISVDAVVSRQFYQGLAILQSLRAEGRLPSRVVVGLGTNGPMSTEQFAELMSLLSAQQRVVVVTVREPREWQDQVNAVIRAGVAGRANVRIADWYAVSAGHPEYFGGDGIHLSTAGADAYARMIEAALR